jgi:hypothetical protein
MKSTLILGAGGVAGRHPSNSLAANGFWGHGFDRKQNPWQELALYDECLEGGRKLIALGFPGPVNIGSKKTVPADQPVDYVIALSAKSSTKKHFEGPTGVRGCSSDNRLIRNVLGCTPPRTVAGGLARTYCSSEEPVRTQELG